MVTKKDLHVGLEFVYAIRPEESKYRITKLSDDYVDFINIGTNYKYSYTYKQILNLLNGNYKITKRKQKNYSIW